MNLSNSRILPRSAFRRPPSAFTIHHSQFTISLSRFRLPPSTFRLALAALFLFAIPSKPAIAQDDSDAAAARSDIAAQVAQIGQDWLRIGTPGAAQYEQAAAMLRGAMKADPREPRYPRLLGTAMHQLNDVDGQIAAWEAYRRLVPEDRSAAARVIELYVSKMQTNEEKVKYLRGLMGNAKLPVEIRAHLAAMCAPLLLQRSNEEAAAVVADGIKLYALPELLDWQYSLVTRHMGPADRIAGMLASLRSNPLQTDVIDGIARELALQGMADESAGWYATKLEVAQRTGIRSSPNFYLNMAIELYLAGQNQLAQQWTTKLLESEPDNISLWFLSLSIARSMHDQQSFVDTNLQARDALSRQWSKVVTQIMTRSGAPATQPADQKSLEPSAILEKLRGLHDRTLNEAFALNLENIIWFALFYENSPKSAQNYLDTLEQSLPADDAELQRLKGWAAAETGKPDEARDLFNAAADRDPIAQLGLIRLDHGKKADIRDRLRELLAKNPTGINAVWIREILLSAEAAPAATQPANDASAGTAPSTMPTTNTATVEAIRDELKRFPSGLYSLVDQPLRFYSVMVEPVQASIRFGDPLLARVTITNRSDYDLVIGFGGPIVPSLLFDAKVTGIAQQEFPSIAFDQIYGPIVLRGHATTQQVVRIDQGPLGELLLQRASGTMIVSGNVMTNPGQFGQNIMPAAGGEDMIFARSFIRLPHELQSAGAKRQLQEDFATGSADDRMHDLQLMGSYIAGMDRETNQDVRDSADLYIRTLSAARGDPNPEVAARAGYLAATLPGVPARLETIQQMLASPAWQSRLMAVAAIRQQPADVQQRLCQPISENDPEPAVKLLAMGLLDALKLPASTQPASQPSTQPATGQ